MQPKRKKTSESDELKVLLSSRRRCSLCFGLKKDFDVKRGQIAHLDRDSSNSKFDNLVFLCLDHHDKYDSTFSQSKGFKKKELAEFRSNLYRYVSEWKKENILGRESIGGHISKDLFSLYALSNHDSILGFELIARNKTEDHIVVISDGLFSIDHCDDSFSESIDKDYIAVGMDFYFPISAIKNALKIKLNEKEFYINLNLSGAGITCVEFGINHNHQFNSRVYDIDNTLNDYIYLDSNENNKAEVRDILAISEVLDTVVPTSLKILNEVGRQKISLSKLFGFCEVTI